LSKCHPQWRLTLASRTLMRLRSTESQAGLTPRQRRINVRGAFSVSDASKVTLQHVLIIDDILTTGATVRSAAQALVEAGAASVWVATLARAQRVSGFGHRFAGEDAEEKDALTGAARKAEEFGSDSSLREQPSF
jgi:glutamine phosphoribosylpyrophosphate amidotransferase